MNFEKYKVMVLEFEKEISRRLNEGILEMEYSVKLLLYKQFPELFELLDFNNLRTFKEPLIYTYFNFSQQTLPMAQILFGYIEKDSRPRTVSVLSDGSGMVYLPNFGYLVTTEPRCELDLMYDRDSDNIELFMKRSSIIFKRLDLDILPGTDIEVLRCNNISFENFFKTEDGVANTQIDRTISHHNLHLQKAFQIIEHNSPFIYSILSDVVRKLFLFSNESQRSFASLGANGCAFFNLRDYDDEVCLLEDITHQCGHIIFYHVLWNKEEYFKVDTNTPLNTVTNNFADERSVLSAFYAFLPYSLICLCLQKCIHNNVFVDRQAFELEGRFAFTMRKFLTDLQNFNNDLILTEEGQRLLKVFEQVACELYETDKCVIEKFDLKNQDYEFNFEKFSEVNYEFAR